MNYKWFYKTPEEFDDMYLTSDGKHLTGLWFKNSKDALKHKVDGTIKELPIFKKTCKWLDIYFKGQNPDFTIEYKIDNLTSFREEITNIMNNIPFGKTITYNDIAKTVAKKRQIKKMSAQAVGGAVGKNPICIIIPCHRVVGQNGNLTGYGGGLKNKIALLKLEGNDMTKFYLKEGKNEKTKLL